ncbi:SlyX family protein [Shumkonia mesophila]|uniref:SlyX family protein n=1 Tax=Shumkonia mesophila TaxID=2838854 RepID=UPI00293420C1|nr:SlyX family protein [Shumkonia mesophila]
MTDPVESRLIDLEIRLAHHERLAEDLSSVMAEQGQVIDRLALQVRRLAERLGDLEAGWRPPQDDKPPPHY